MDGVFLFEDVAVEDNKTMQGYDAIVVEQWTVLKVCFSFIYLINQNTLRLQAYSCTYFSSAYK